MERPSGSTWKTPKANFSQTNLQVVDDSLRVAVVPQQRIQCLQLSLFRNVVNRADADPYEVKITVSRVGELLDRVVISVHVAP